MTASGRPPAVQLRFDCLSAVQRRSSDLTVVQLQPPSAVRRVTLSSRNPQYSPSPVANHSPLQNPRESLPVGTNLVQTRRLRSDRPLGRLLRLCTSRTTVNYLGWHLGTASRVVKNFCVVLWSVFENFASKTSIFSRAISRSRILSLCRGP